jgi:hypothetical protein
MGLICAMKTNKRSFSIEKRIPTASKELFPRFPLIAAGNQERKGEKEKIPLWFPQTPSLTPPMEVLKCFIFPGLSGQ